MNWVVKTYLQNYHLLKDDPDISEDTRDSLISLDEAIKSLKDSKVFIGVEEKVLDLTLKGYTLTDISKILKITFVWSFKTLNRVCAKITRVLGEGFTDETFLYTFVKNNRLKPQDIIRAEEKIYNDKRD